MEKNAFFNVKELYFKYPQATRNALDGLTLNIPQNSFFGLLGPNGSGKTTFVSFICGLLDGKYEEAELFGVPHAYKELYQRKIGYAPQEIALYPMLSGLENAVFFARLAGIKKVHARVREILEFVDLWGDAHKKVSHYSGGMKRRLNLAVALLGNPELLILDEPTVGVDPQSRNLIFEKLIELKKTGLTLLYSTHYMEEVTKLCDDVAIMKNGKVIVQGPLEEILPAGKNKSSRVGLGLELEERYLELTGRKT